MMTFYWLDGPCPRIDPYEESLAYEVYLDSKESEKMTFEQWIIQQKEDAEDDYGFI